MNIKKRPNHKLYIHAFRRMSPEQRLLKAFELSQFSRDLFLHGLRKRFPDLSDDDIKKIYLERHEKNRIISARRATGQERKIYEDG